MLSVPKEAAPATTSTVSDKQSALIFELDQSAKVIALFLDSLRGQDNLCGYEHDVIIRLRQLAVFFDCPELSDEIEGILHHRLDTDFWGLFVAASRLDGLDIACMALAAATPHNMGIDMLKHIERLRVSWRYPLLSAIVAESKAYRMDKLCWCGNGDEKPDCGETDMYLKLNLDGERLVGHFMTAIGARK